MRIATLAATMAVNTTYYDSVFDSNYTWDRITGRTSEAEVAEELHWFGFKLDQMKAKEEDGEMHFSVLLALCW